MNPDVNLSQLKARLRELIKNSPTLNSLTEAQRKARTDAMLLAEPDTMQQFIDVLEGEAEELAKINQEFASGENNEKIGQLMAEAKKLEKNIKGEVLIEEEKASKKLDEAKIEELLKKLDEIK